MQFLKLAFKFKCLYFIGNLIDARVSAMPEGQIFWTITHGKGLMGPYNGVLSVHDRWAVVAYVKSLQAAAGN